MPVPSCFFIMSFILLGEYKNKHSEAHIPFQEGVTYFHIKRISFETIWCHMKHTLECAVGMLRTFHLQICLLFCDRMGFRRVHWDMVAIFFLSSNYPGIFFDILKGIWPGLCHSMGSANKRFFVLEPFWGLYWAHSGVPWGSLRWKITYNKKLFCWGLVLEPFWRACRDHLGSMYYVGSMLVIFLGLCWAIWGLFGCHVGPRLGQLVGYVGLYGDHWS